MEIQQQVKVIDLQVTSSLMEPAGRRSDTLLKVKVKAQYYIGKS